MGIVLSMSRRVLPPTKISVWATETGQHLLTVPQQLRIACIRRVAGHDQQDRDGLPVAAGTVRAVGQISKNSRLQRALKEAVRSLRELGAPMIRPSAFRMASGTGSVRHGRCCVL